MTWHDFRQGIDPT